jgi:hypothetical protein
LQQNLSQEQQEQQQQEGGSQGGCAFAAWERVRQLVAGEVEVDPDCEIPALQQHASTEGSAVQRASVAQQQGPAGDYQAAAAAASPGGGDVDMQDV